MLKKYNLVCKETINKHLNSSEYETAINYIMVSQNVNKKEAIEIYNEIALTEIQQTIDSLIKQGLVKVSGYNDNGEKKFSLTELGKQCAKELKKQNKK